jgi:hypothetical protein
MGDLSTASSALLHPSPLRGGTEGGGPTVGHIATPSPALLGPFGPSGATLPSKGREGFVGNCVQEYSHV